MDPKNTIWTEKYRPKKVSEMVGEFKIKILKYLKKPEAIPHFLFYSKTPGTGKCLTGDEMFFFDNGLISFDRYKKIYLRSKKEKIDIEEDLYCPIHKWIKSSYFYQGKDNVIKITTKRGFEIKGTKEHKIKIFDREQGIVWKKLSEINYTDIIPIFYNTNIFGNNNKVDFNIFHKLKYKADHSSKMIKQFLEINNDIAFFIGVFVANGLFNGGGGLRISTFKKELQERLLSIIEENFGIKGRFSDYKGFNEGVDFSSVWLKRFLVNICGCSKKTAREKRIPDIILRASKDIQMNFLYGLMEDSWISKENYIEYSTASKKLAKEFQLVCLNLGYVVKKSEKYLEEYNHTYYNLTFAVEDSKRFLKNFNYIYKTNKIIFKENMNTNVLSYNTIIRKFVQYQRKQNKITKKKIFDNNLVRLDEISGSIKKVKKQFKKLLDENYLRETIEIFKNNDVFLDEIVSKKELKKQPIYDFHIPKTHSFLASGIINHNTSLAKAIINELNCDALILNSSDDRKIDVVRSKVKEFSITQSSKKGLRRCVFLDEFDGMLIASQNALRNIMETYAKNVFFILTCNNINKVIEPLKSRCKLFPFAYPDKEEIKVYLKHICEQEKMEFTDDGIMVLIDANYPSIRNCVITLQDLYTDELSVIPDNVKPVNELFEQMWVALKEKKWFDIKKEVLQTTLDPRELNSFFWNKFLDETNVKGIQITCRNERDIALGSDPKIILVTSLIELVK